MCDECDYSGEEEPLFIAQAPIRKGQLVTLELPNTGNDRGLARHVLPASPPAPDVRAYPELRRFGRRVSRAVSRERVGIGICAAWVLARALGLL